MKGVYKISLKRGTHKSLVVNGKRTKVIGLESIRGSVKKAFAIKSVIS